MRNVFVGIRIGPWKEWKGWLDEAQRGFSEWDVSDRCFQKNHEDYSQNTLGQNFNFAGT